MSSFTKEDMKSARVSDLFGYLSQYHPQEFIRSGRYLNKRDNKSLSIRSGIGGYYDFSNGESGNSVDFLVRHMGYSITDAVEALCGSTGAGYKIADVPVIKLKELQVVFPEPCKGPYKNLYAYLTGRGISAGTIKLLSERKLIYQDTRNNIVFINQERDWGEIRGTNTYADKRCALAGTCGGYSAVEHGWCCHQSACDGYRSRPFRRMAEHSRADGFWWFQIGKGRAEAVYVCEAAIDAISLYELHRLSGRAENAVYASIGGTAKQPAINRLKRHRRAILAVDNDAVGEKCRHANPDMESIVPTLKDWNDDLMAKVR